MADDDDWEEAVEPSQDYDSFGNRALLEMLASGNIGGPGGLCPLNDDAEVPPVHLPRRLGGDGGDVDYSYTQIVTHSLTGTGGDGVGPGLSTAVPAWQRPTSQTSSYHINGDGTWRNTNADPSVLSKYTYDSGGSLPANQYAEIQIGVRNTYYGEAFGLVLKSSVTAYTGIYVRWYRSGQIQASVYSGGWGASRATAFRQPQAHDVFRAELVGEVITLKVNGQIVGQVSSSEFAALSGSRAGISLHPDCHVRNFKAGSVSKTVAPQRGSITTLGTTLPANPFNGDNFVHLGTGTVYVWSD